MPRVPNATDHSGPRHPRDYHATDHADWRDHERASGHRYQRRDRDVDDQFDREPRENHHSHEFGGMQHSRENRESVSNHVGNFPHTSRGDASRMTSAMERTDPLLSKDTRRWSCAKFERLHTQDRRFRDVQRHMPASSHQSSGRHSSANGLTNPESNKPSRFSRGRSSSSRLRDRRRGSRDTVTPPATESISRRRRKGARPARADHYTRENKYCQSRLPR